MDEMLRDTDERAVNGKSISDKAEGCGCTSCVVLLTPDKIICANAGDSRAVLVKAPNKPEPLSKDHKPNDPVEEARINANGIDVMDGRVDGNLAVARAIGDLNFKSTREKGEGDDDDYDDEDDKELKPPETQAITALPDIKEFVRVPGEDVFILNACDGIWDVISNEEMAARLAKNLDEKPGAQLSDHVAEMFDDTVAKNKDDAKSGNGGDNMTAILIKFTG